MRRASRSRSVCVIFSSRACACSSGGIAGWSTASTRRLKEFRYVLKGCGSGNRRITRVVLRKLLVGIEIRDVPDFYGIMNSKTIGMNSLDGTTLIIQQDERIRCTVKASKTARIVQGWGAELRQEFEESTAAREKNI